MFDFGYVHPKENIMDMDKLIPDGDEIVPGRFIEPGCGMPVEELLEKVGCGPSGVVVVLDPITDKERTAQWIIVCAMECMDTPSKWIVVTCEKMIRWLYDYPTMQPMGDFRYTVNLEPRRRLNNGHQAA